eukprot:CAMPEP_0117849604 /NCGR_PEP_ID=MMETSP0949-20121206/21193_1 /TAXON_ID=44440 /ORGANISM="Chattonella subsalsa, Strain CCMP2191" /LENGTH=109 /DNA_ID=CAMNT_0005696843 /DNA_START=924 /DNA_END=1253 /DNA_ORIENTATION=-
MTIIQLMQRARDHPQRGAVGCVPEGAGGRAVAVTPPRYGGAEAWSGGLAPHNVPIGRGSAIPMCRGGGRVTISMVSLFLDRRAASHIIYQTAGAVLHLHTTEPSCLAAQ